MYKESRHGTEPITSVSKTAYTFLLRGEYGKLLLFMAYYNTSTNIINNASFNTFSRGTCERVHFLQCLRGLSQTLSELSCPHLSYVFAVNGV